MLTLKAINELNKSYWQQQNALRDERAEDLLLLQMLDRELNSFSYRFVPQSRNSVEQIFEEAAEARKLVLEHCEPSIRKEALREQARQAGRSRKPDALQRIIIEIVSKSPNITAKQLRQKLEDQAGPSSVIDEVDEEEVHFRNRIGSREFLDSAPISGLKDRLSRAKKFLRSR